MKKILILLSLCFVLMNEMYGQKTDDIYYLPQFALKTNMLYWATTTMNIGMEAGLSKRMSLDVSANLNPWTFSNHKKIKHFLIQPEVRYWLCERFNGHFFGLHGHYAKFSVGGIKQLGLRTRKYEGELYGGGISYGYQWILGKRWNLEATIGVGYAYIDYEKYSCKNCGMKIKDDTRNYFGPTKAGISFIYIIK